MTIIVILKIKLVDCVGLYRIGKGWLEFLMANESGFGLEKIALECNGVD